MTTRSSTEARSVGMQSVFQDHNSNHDYDQRIERTRQLATTLDPCEALDQFELLVTNLQLIRPTYFMRPCIEGFCFGMFTPHHSRIDRRISVLTAEVQTHQRHCQRYLSELEGHRNREHQERLHQQSLNAGLQHRSTTTTKTEVVGAFPPNS